MVLEAAPIVACAQSRWPGISIPTPELTRALERFDAHGSVRFPEELSLAIACAAGDPVATGAFEREVLSPVLGSARRLVKTSDSLQELAQIVRVRLLQRRPEAAPRIADYNGSVPLRAWVRVIVRHCAINLEAARPGQGENLEAHLDRLVQGATPEQLVGRDQFSGRFQTAFSEAVHGLEPRARAVLRLHLVDGVSLEGLAKVYGVHRATVARWIATARAAVLEGTRQALARELGENADVDSLMCTALSNLDVNLSSVFRDASSAATP